MHSIAYIFPPLLRSVSVYNNNIFTWNCPLAVPFSFFFFFAPAGREGPGLW